MKKFIAIVTLATIAFAPVSLIAGEKDSKTEKAPSEEKAKKECPAKKGCGDGEKKECPKQPKDS